MLLKTPHCHVIKITSLQRNHVIKNISPPHHSKLLPLSISKHLTMRRHRDRLILTEEKYVSCHVVMIYTKQNSNIYFAD